MTWAVTIERHPAAPGVPEYATWEIFDVATNMVLLDGTVSPGCEHFLTEIVAARNNPPLVAALAQQDKEAATGRGLL